MIRDYVTRLSVLQDAMLKELEDFDDLKKEEYTTSQAAEMILKYESLIKSHQVCMNHGNRGLKVKWIKSNALDACDTLDIVHNEDIQRSESEKQELVENLEFLLRSVDWLYEFKKKFRSSVKSAHKVMMEQDDVRRDQTIEENAMNYDEMSQPNTNNRQQPNIEGTATTKDKLLNKTKQLSANLIRGNQILQSAVLQSDLNMDELQEQTNSLSKMNDKYMQFETVFMKTSQLVKKLEKASHQEKRDVYLALGFLCVCVSWVLWRRIFKMPVKIALWLTFKFFKGILVTIGLAKNVASSTQRVLAPPVTAFIESTTTFITTTETADTIEQAVNEAMSRIISHDEL